MVHQAVHHPARCPGHRPQVVLALAREHLYLVAGHGVGSGEVEQGVIEGDGADTGHDPAIHSVAGLVGKLAGKRIAKPDVQGADPHRGRSGEGAEVGDGIALRDLLHVLDARLQGQHLAKLETRSVVPVERIDPVETHRGAHHVEPGVGRMEDGVGARHGAERNLHATPLDLGAHRPETREHLAVAVGVLHEAREHPGHADVRHPRDPLDEVRGEIVTHADPTQPRVHLHEHLRDTATAAARGVERKRRLFGEHRHRQPLLDDAVALRVGEQHVHHQHVAPDARGTQPFGLEELGDHHPADALGDEMRRDGNESVPVGVVLHHRHHFDPDPLPDPRQVEAQVVEVELDPRRVLAEPANDLRGARLGSKPGMEVGHRRLQVPLRLPPRSGFTNVADTGRHRRVKNVACLRQPDASFGPGEQNGAHRRFELAQRPTDLPCGHVEVSRRSTHGAASYRGFQHRQLMRPMGQPAVCLHLPVPHKGYARHSRQLDIVEKYDLFVQCVYSGTTLRVSGGRGEDGQATEHRAHGRRVTMPWTSTVKWRSDGSPGAADGRRPTGARPDWRPRRTHGRRCERAPRFRVAILYRPTR